MVLKSLVVGLLLSCSLLVLGMSVKKTLPAAFGFVLVLPLSLLSSWAAFIAFGGYAIFLLAWPAAAGSTTPSFRVVAVSGPLHGREYKLSGRSASLEFGREKCKVLFPANTSGVSRHHCRVFLKDGSAYIEDKGSQYGTYLLPSAKRLQPGYPERLEDGQSFCLARKEIMFVIKRN